MSITNVKETQLPFTIKRITCDWKCDNSECIKCTFDGKFIDNIMVSTTIGYITYNGTFDENYCLHGNKCKIYTDPAIRLNFKYKGEFEHGCFKKGKLHSGKHGYYTYSKASKHLMYEMDGWWESDECHRDKLEDCCIICDGEFDMHSGYLLKGKLTHKFKLGYEFNYLTFKDEKVGYIKSKEGTFSLTIPYTLTEGKQILHNGVIMEGTFHGEQLRHGKVIYHSNAHGTRIIEGNFTNDVFDWDGNLYKNRHMGASGKLICPKTCACIIM